MIDFEFHPDASKEFADAFEFYFGRSSKLAERFDAAVNQALLEIAARPASWPQLDHRHRLKLVGDRFPYQLIYRFDDTKIVVVAISHHHRRPNYWRSR